MHVYVSFEDNVELVLEDKYWAHKVELILS